MIVAHDRVPRIVLNLKSPIHSGSFRRNNPNHFRFTAMNDTQKNIVHHASNSGYPSSCNAMRFPASAFSHWVGILSQVSRTLNVFQN